MDQPEVIVFTGIQASGKSTFYKQYFFDTHVRINLDMLKTHLRERILFHACLVAQQSMVIDDTNVTSERRSRYIKPARSVGFSVTGYYFEASLEDAIRRNAQRTGNARIPERGLHGMAAKLEKPYWEEGFDKLYTVKINKDNTFDVIDYPLST